MDYKLNKCEFPTRKYHIIFNRDFFKLMNYEEIDK